MTTRSTRLLALLGLVGILAGYALTSHREFNYDRDNAIYFGLARSLATGGGYEFNGVQHTQYPPGAALLLAPVHAATGGDPALLHGYVGLWGAMAVLLAFAWYRRRQEGWAGGLLLLLIVSPDLYEAMTGGPVAGALYTALSLGLLLWSEHETTTPRGYGNWLLGGFLALAALSVHSTGVAIVAALVASGAHRYLTSMHAEGAVRRLAGTAAIVAAATAAQVAWMAWGASAGSVFYPGEFTLSYVNQLLLVDSQRPDLGSVTLLGAVVRTFQNIPRDMAHVAGLLTNIVWIKEIWFSPPLVLTAVFCGLGLIRELRRPNPVAGWYAIFFFGLVATWPYDEGRRLLVPILPVLLVLAAGGIRALVDWVIRAGPRRAAVATIGGSATLLAGGILHVILFPEAVSSQDYAALAFWAMGAVAAGGTLLLQPTTLEAVARRAFPVALGGFVLGASLLGLPVLANNLRVNVAADPSEWRHYQAALTAEWLNQNASPGDRAMAQDYAQLHYATGLQVIPLPITGRASTLVEALERTAPRYVVIHDPLPNPYYLPEEVERLEVIESELDGALTLAHRHELGSVYLFTPPEGP